MNLKNYINQNPIFKQSVISDEVGWNRPDMSKWLNGKLDIPKKYENRIKQFLAQYGYKE